MSSISQDIEQKRNFGINQGPYLIMSISTHIKNLINNFIEEF